MKEVTSDMKIILMVFLRKAILWGNQAIFGPKIKCTRKSGYAPMTFSKILLSKKGKKFSRQIEQIACQL